MIWEERWGRAVSSMICAAVMACGEGQGDASSNVEAGAREQNDAGADAAAALVGSTKRCDTARHASAYRAKAGASEEVDSPNTKAITSCLSLTGHGANEPGLGIASDGTVYFAPALTSEGNGVLRSNDGGETWKLSIPRFEGGGGHPKLQPFFHLDRSGDRLFFSSSKLVLDGLSTFKDDPGIHLSVSGDGAGSWRHQVLAPECRDWQKIFTGPAVSSKPKGYPNVVYFSVPSPIAGNWAGIYPAPDFQHFYKSLDGGETFQEVSQLPIAPAAIPGCDARDYAMFAQGVVGRDGTIFLSFRRCRQLAVAISRDEGKTWEYRDVPGAVLPPYDTSSLLGILGIVGGENAITGQPIAVDTEGNLYAVWTDTQNRLFYASSKDQGKSWSKPVSAMAPGVREIRMVAITAQSKGRVAFAYFGSKDSVAYHGYIAETLDGLADEPVFVTTTANDPKEPLYPEGWQSGYDLTYFDNGGDEITLIQVEYGPEGDVWASFVKDMCPRGDRSACTWDYNAHAESRFQGALGRLVHAP